VIVTVHWETAYRYSEPVRLLHTELRVVPGDRTGEGGGGQRLIDCEMTLDPPAKPQALRDLFGNTLHHVDFLQPVERLVVAVRAEVETSPAPEPAGRMTPLLDWMYRQPTPRAAFNDAFRVLAPADLAGQAPTAAARAVTEAIHGRFGFEVGATNVTHNATDLLEAGSGVCQDFAHLALALLRMHGFAARYVSGYLGSEHGDALAEASHAWVQVLDAGAWHGFDPANGGLEDERYVVTAVGRDYDDVPPLRGTFGGVADQEWTTSIRIATSGVPQ
jgi:transglutaminase-like putative cysteine protease